MKINETCIKNTNVNEQIFLQKIQKGTDHDNALVNENFQFNRVENDEILKE